jgi:hypothetical protein
VTHPRSHVADEGPFVSGEAAGVAGGVGEAATASPPSNEGDVVAGTFVKGSSARSLPPLSHATSTSAPATSRVRVLRIGQAYASVVANP